MTLDPVHHHILEQRILKDTRNMNPHHIPTEFARDPLNSHYDDRRAWLSWRADVPRASARHRLGRMITRLGHTIQGASQEPAPAQTTTRS